MIKISTRRLLRTFVAVCAVLLFTNFNAPAQDAPSYDLKQILFVYNSETLDRDRDGLKDSLEFKLADTFKPYLIFDKDENARLPQEPKVLFQVRPEGCIGEGCSTPWTVWIGYSFLFLQDGGYGPEASCPGILSQKHAGDNDRLRIKLESNDGRNWKIVRIEVGAGPRFVYPGIPVEWYPDVPTSRVKASHVKIYMSAHKHHMYFDTKNNHATSAYSSISSGIGPIGCDEDVAGDGYRVLPTLISPLNDNRPSNVGESEFHNSAYFINDLALYGFNGQKAWGGEFYKSNTDMIDVWMKHNFSLGEQFCIYLTPGVSPSRTHITMTFLSVKRFSGGPVMPTNSFKFDAVVNGQRSQYQLTVANEATVQIAGNSNLTLSLLECGILNLSLLARDSNNAIIGKAKDITLDKATNFGHGENRTVEITMPHEDIANRVRKLFEVTYRINVWKIPNNRRGS